MEVRGGGGGGLHGTREKGGRKVYGKGEMRAQKAGFTRLWEAGNWETNDSFVYRLSQGIVTLMWVVQHCITLNTSQSKKRREARANKKSRDWEQSEREANSLGPPSPPPPQKIAKVQSQVCSASAS